MLSSLEDDYTRFMTPQAYREMKIETDGEFQGVGMQIGIKKKKLIVVSPLPDTPAFKSGIKSGDWIIKIDGKSTKDMSLQEAVTLIRGKKGTKVILVIRRQKVKKDLTFEIIRDVIHLKSTSSKFVGKNIGYIKLNIFNENTAYEIEDEISKLKKKANLQALILDLRFNPGGLLNASVDVASLFIDEGNPIVKVEGRKDGTVILKSRNIGKIYTYPMVVLVNGFSASASEIVTGALQDYKIATVIGSRYKDDEIMKTGRTFGKGSVQTLHPLRDGSAVAITTAKYYTAKGRDINKKGLEPDIVVNITKKDLQGKVDTQLGKAKKVLLKKITMKKAG
jgi:carboxyl-terminal processing protease